jgi:hypothetical protein
MIWNGNGVMVFMMEIGIIVARKFEIMVTSLERKKKGRSSEMFHF